MEIITLDTRFHGAGHIIASYLVPTGDGRFALIESGPASTAAGLARAITDAGYQLDRLQAVFLTHIHLDHGGAAGQLARETGCTIYAHPVGVHHLVEPEKLIKSAERLYGDRMLPLWGAVQSIPEDQAYEIDHGEEVRVGEARLTGWHTPGHAVHHVCWQIGDAVATGDLAGIRFPGLDYVLPPTPPPDIDTETWCESIELLRGLQPQRLLLTHFGAFNDVTRHLDELQERLLRWRQLARECHDQGKQHLAEQLAASVKQEMNERGITAAQAERYLRVCPVADSAAGLRRYWSKTAPKPA